MSTKTISSRDFNQDVGAAKRAAFDGPVVITDRGQPSHVLLSIAEYQRLVGEGQPIGTLLANRAAADVDFDPPRIGSAKLKVPELSTP